MSELCNKHLIPIDNLFFDDINRLCRSPLLLNINFLLSCFIFLQTEKNVNLYYFISVYGLKLSKIANFNVNIHNNSFIRYNSNDFERIE